MLAGLSALGVALPDEMETLEDLRMMCSGPGSVAYTKGDQSGRALQEKNDSDLQLVEGAGARLRVWVLDLPTADASGWQQDDEITVAGVAALIRQLGPIEDGLLTRVIVVEDR